MNTHDKIELPPLPPLHIVPSVEPVDYPEVARALIDYARTAIKADRQRRNKALQAECEKLRTAMIEAKSYIDHYMYGGSIYREPAEEAIAIIDAAMEGDKP